ncbi:flagellar biosynthetic protein FliO [Vagococcus carniphilus]|uniref:Flagellar biosynthetic protein FliO n=1 Tax=Vagococcus carniphilus TaxID=218144 RepID=A0AAW8U5Z0_9ENTE|nr:flagellar biosynthetic protein FliO [Vagococcus carniphilus]MDT2815868.1 flagellar biosynthetic protein FliO [Vagococcus carniphilus]MDT2829621.1 flagellar biosynthetic protein FliO [Vagococcus carniphilus]MDT2833677.1 flagellar biosynthetic protein FliO [Vagococcus carniphilus]MDT2839080.1 flagellar biosynthetic protein FliO [Vagococcus carniphilus]MDT2847630.1 flagellar biosynthetic protein FliO [Vagococcus carniphilus]
MTSFFLLFKSIVFLVVIILLIQITLTYVNKFNQTQSKNIEIIEKLSVSKDSSMAIVLVCGSYYLMSLTPSGNQMIKKLNEIEVREIQIQQMVDTEFQQKRQEQFLMQCQNWFKKFKKKGIKNGKAD